MTFDLMARTVILSTSHHSPAHAKTLNTGSLSANGRGFYRVLARIANSAKGSSRFSTGSLTSSGVGTAKESCNTQIFSRTTSVAKGWLPK